MLKLFAPSMRADSRSDSGNPAKYVLVRMIYHMLKLAGMTKAHILLYNPSFDTSRNEGISPPPKYMGTKRKAIIYFRPINFFEVNGYAHVTLVSKTRIVVDTT